MTRNTYLALLAAVAIPFAAVAQEQTTQEPAEQTDELLKNDTQTGDSAQQQPAEEPAEQTAEEAAPTEEQPAEQTAEEETMPADDTEQAAETEDPAAGGAATDTEMAGADAVEGPFVTVPQTGAWRVTDLEGKTVQDANGENIGDISDVLVNESGEVIAVLVGVGGFLGIGEKNVAVSMSALEFGPGKTDGLKTQEEMEQESAAQAPATDTTGTGTGTMGGTTNQTADVQPVEDDPVVGEDNLPDRIVLNVTREELEAAPAYEDVQEGIDTGATSATEAPMEEPAAPAEQPAD